MAARFIRLALCGALSAWPALARAQQSTPETAASGRSEQQDIALVAATPAGQAAPDLGDVDAHVEQARALFWSAHERYDAGEYAEAARLFEESYAVFPQPELLFNIALARARSGRCREAERAFDAYSEAVGSSEATRAANDNFQGLLSECSEASEASPGVSELPEPAPGAAATDTSRAPKAKLAAIVLPPLVPVAADTPPPSYWTTQRVVGWSLLGAAAAATGVAIYYDNQRRYALEASDPNNTGDYGAELEDQYNRANIGIAVATTAALGCAAVGVGLLVYSGDGAASTTAQVAVDPSGARIGLAGRF